MKRKNEKRTTKSRKKGKQTGRILPPEIMSRIGYFYDPPYPNSQKGKEELEVLNKICPNLIQGFNKSRYERIFANKNNGISYYYRESDNNEELYAVINDPEKAKYVKCLLYRGFQGALPKFKNLTELISYHTLPQKLLQSIPILDSFKCLYFSEDTPDQFQEVLKYQVDLRKESQNPNILSCYWGPINEQVAQYLDVLGTQTIGVNLVDGNLALVIGYLKKVKSLEFKCDNIDNLDFTEAIPQIMELKNMEKFHFGVKTVASTFYDALLHCVLIQNEATLVDFNIKFADDTLKFINSQLSFDCRKPAESQLYLSLANVCNQIQSSKALSSYRGPINGEIAEYLEMRATQTIDVKLAGNSLSRVFEHLKNIQNIRFECGNLSDSDLGEAVPQIMELKNMHRFYFDVKRSNPVASTFYDALLRCVLIHNASTLEDFDIRSAYTRLHFNNSHLEFACWKPAEPQEYLRLLNNVCNQIESLKGLSRYRGPINGEIADCLEMLGTQIIDVEAAGKNLSRVFEHLKTIPRISFKCENPNDSDLGEAAPQVLGLKNLTTLHFHLSLKGPINERRKLRNGPGYTKFYEALVNHVLPQNAPTIENFHLNADDALNNDAKLCMDKRPVLELSPDLHFLKLSNLRLQFMPTVCKSGAILIGNAPMLQTLHIQETLTTKMAFSAHAKLLKNEM